MCGRFTYRLTWEEIVRLYGLTLDQPARNTQARYNVCPTDQVDTIVERDGKRELVPMRWGLIPRWWSRSLKDMKAVTFNGRAETVDTKPFFRTCGRVTQALCHS
jgi:putative SOS response-associated peptidase YedK